MTKQEFLAASLPYNLKCQYCGVISYDIDCDGDDVNHQYGNKVALLKELRFYKKYWIAKCGVKSMALKRFNNGDGLLPIIRPLDSLTKECVQAGYNDGKPFIPIVELAKIADPHSLYAKRIFFSNQLLRKLNSYSVVFYNKGGLSEMYFEYIVDEATFCMIDENGKRLVHNQFRLFQLLLKWHFWPNMPKGEEVVYVSENFNPYK